MEQQQSISSAGTATRPVKSLVELLLATDDRRPTRRLISILLDALVGMPFNVNDPTQSIIAPQAVHILLSLLPHSEHSFQLEIIANLTRLAGGTLRNAQVCCDFGVVHTLFQILPTLTNDVLFERGLKLVSVLGKHHISVPEMKQMLNCMKRQLDTGRADRLALLVGGFEKMTLRDGPLSAFYFDGSKDCALMLPPFPLPSGGYSLCGWIRIEHMASPVNHFRVFSMLNEEGDGLIVWLAEKHGHIMFHVAVLSGGASTTQFFETAPIQAKTWHFFTLSHVSKLFGRSEVKLYVDGKHRQSKNLSYLSQSKPMSRSWVGADSGVTFSAVPASGSFFGQIAAISFYGEALADDRISQLAATHPDGARQTTIVHGQNLIWFYHPNAAEKQIAFDIGPWSLHSAFLGTILASTSLPATEALFCVGGIASFFPFFYHLDDMKNSTVLPTGKDPSADIDGLSSQLIRLIAAILRCSESNRQDILSSNGFGILSYIFEEVSKEHVNLKLLIALDELFSALAVESLSLTSDMYTRLFFNFRVWSRVPFALQKNFIVTCIKHVQSRTSFFRELIGVQGFLDAMQLYYPYNEEGDNHGTNGTTDLPLTNQDISELRSMMFHGIKAMVQNEITEEEVKSLISFVLDSPKTAEVADVLHLILWLCAKSTSKTYAAIKPLGDIGILFGMLHHADENIRVLILRSMSFVITGAYQPAKRSHVLSTQLTPWLVSALAEVPFSEATYNSLVELLVGRPHYPAGEPSKLSYHSNVTFKAPELDGSFRIENPELFPAVFRLLKNCPLELQTKILHDFLILLSHGKLTPESVHNCNLFMHRDDWPNWIFEILVRTEQILRDESRTASDRDNATILREMTITILNSFLYFSIVSKRDGWKAIARILAFLELFKEQLNRVKLLRLLFSSLLTSITTDFTRTDPGTTIGASAKHNLGENMAYVVLFLEEFLFHYPDGAGSMKVWDASGESNVAELNEQQLRSYMHRSKKMPEFTVAASAASSDFAVTRSCAFSSSLRQTPDKLTYSSGATGVRPVWKDLDLARQLIEVIDALGCYADMNRVDPIAFFSKERHGPLHALLRILIAALTEAPAVFDPHRVKQKRIDLLDLEKEIMQDTHAGILDNDFTRKQLAKYFQDKTEELARQEKSLEQYYAKGVDRIRALLTVLNNGLSGTPSISPRSLESSTEITLHVVHQLFRLFKQLFTLGESVHLAVIPGIKTIIRNNLEGILDSCIPSDTESNPFLENRHSFEAASHIREFVQFFHEASFKQNLRKRLELATQIIEASQVGALKSIVVRRDAAASEARFLTDTALKDAEEAVQKSLRENTPNAQKYSYKEMQRRLSRAYTERKYQDKLAGHFSHLWRQMNDASPVWRSTLIETRKNERQRAFTKLDKSEQALRVRVKIKTNYQGKQHTEASFSYLKVKWEKEAEELKMRKLAAEQLAAAEKAQQELPLPPTSPSPSPPRPSSPELTQESGDTAISSGDTSLAKPEGARPKALELVKAASSEDMSANSSPRNGANSAGSTPRNRSAKLRKETRPGLGKSAVIAIENEIDEMFASVDEDEFLLLDNTDVTKELEKSASDQVDLLFSSKCEIIYQEIIIPGRLDVTRTTIYFFYDREAARLPTDTGELKTAGDIGPAEYLKWTRRMFGAKFRDREWSVESVVGVFSRRYLLNWTAVELFFENNRTYLINFPKGQNRLLYKSITSLRPRGLKNHFFLTGAEIFKKNAAITEKWKRREISNFEYLMHLNEWASRTYNDLTQYPVFPWILKDYKSDRIDLSNPASYRDLRTPIGALEPERFTKFADRYENWVDDSIPPFHYGSHYSSAGSVLFYLIRMEPWTSQFICLQGGKFDWPDRLFSSIPETWENCLKSTTDVKELIPEFFCLPEFLMNRNKFDFGVKSTGTSIDHVELPPWAKTPEDFIRIHRDALESEYVSNNLHHWIDLIFGYKQRGESAIEARNTFYYLTYEGAVDIDSLWNPVQKKAVLDQIENFGQTPAQLLTTAHPQRDPPRGNLHLWYPLDREIPSFVFAHTAQAMYQLPFNSPSFIHVFKDKLITINTYGELLSHSWTIQKYLLAGEDSPVKVDLDLHYSTSSSLSSLPASVHTRIQKIQLTKAISDRALGGTNRRIDYLNVTHHSANTKRHFLVHPDDPGVVFSYGHWDATIQVSKLNTAATKADEVVCKVYQAVLGHKAPVTAAAVDGEFLVSASSDGTACLWRGLIRKDKKEVFTISTPPLYHLRVHTAPIASVAINRKWDLIVTGSVDGVVAIHHLNLRRTDTRHIIELESEVSSILIAPDGSVVVYCSGNTTLYRFNINADPIAKRNIKQEKCGQDQVDAMVVTTDGKYLLVAGDSHIAVRRLFDLEIVYVYKDLPGFAFDMAFDEDGRVLFVTLMDGKLICYSKKDGSTLIP